MNLYCEINEGYEAIKSKSRKAHAMAFVVRSAHRYLTYPAKQAPIPTLDGHKTCTTINCAKQQFYGCFSCLPKLFYSASGKAFFIMITD